METYLWVIFIMLFILSIIPLTHWDLFNVDKKYRYFKFTSVVLVIWSFINFLRFVVKDPFFLYYLSLGLYPIIFLIVTLLFIAIITYLDLSINKIYLYLLGLLVIIDAIFSLTNQFHFLILKLTPAQSTSYEVYKTVEVGMVFQIHTILSYLLLLIITVLLVKKFYTNLKSHHDIYPFLFILVGILTGLVLNFIHVFIYTFTIDPTYTTFVLVLSLLYYIFYMRDLKLILGLNRNRFILDNLREKYVIVNQNNIVVDASSEFIKLFNINLEDKISFEKLKLFIEKRAVIYRNQSETDEKFNEDKLYFSMKEKHIHLPFYKFSGSFYLFYDETANQKYIHDMNYIKTHDLMSSLYNRNFFEELAKRLNNEQNSYSVVMFDLDGLKLFNDYLGHDAGDQLINRFASQLKKLTDYHNVVAIRMGGDEFLVIATEKEKGFLDTLITKLKSLNKDKEILEQVHFSYGVALNPDGKKDIDTILAEADKKMYEMKDEKNQYKTDLRRLLEKSKQK